MKIIIENFRKFIDEGYEDLENKTSTQIDEDSFNRVTEWAGVSNSDSMKLLGHATMGSAYKINSDEFGEVVLKLTQDSEEANNAAILLESGQEHPNVYKIYKVGKIAGTRMYAIITELLQQPIPEISYAMGQLEALTRMKAGKQILYKWPGIESLTIGKDLSGLSGWNLASAKETNKLYKELYNSIQAISQTDDKDSELVKKSIDEIADGLTFLNKMGIRFSDLKGSNVLQRGDDPVIIDLGRTKPPRYIKLEQI